MRLLKKLSIGSYNQNNIKRKGIKHGKKKKRVDPSRLSSYLFKRKQQAKYLSRRNRHDGGFSAFINDI
jgi:hypothetical protein